MRRNEKHRIMRRREEENKGEREKEEKLKTMRWSQEKEDTKRNMDEIKKNGGEGKVSEEQGGFRKGRECVDQIFAMKRLVEEY